MELLFEAVGTFAIGFVEDEDVADFHQAGFHILNVVTEAGDEDYDDAIGEANDVDFVLADTNGFDKDLALASGVEEECDFSGGASEAAEESARGHGADEDSRVACVGLHADAIAENCSTSVRAGGVDGDYADGFVVFAVMGG